VTGLANSTAYTFRVSAVNAAGTGTASTTSATTATVPGAPGCCSWPYGLGGAALAWTAPTSDGGSPITDYTIEYSSDDGVTWLTWVDHISATFNSSGVPFAGEPSNTYLVRVSAVNAVGTGSPSAAVSN
jgi:predicted phage tail protein